VSYNAPMDKVEKFKNAKYVFVVGIGGSDLASKAVWSALTLHRSEVSKKLFFLEAPDSREYAEVDHFINDVVADIAEVALVVVSKSGETVETLETYHKTFDMLSEKFGAPVTERVLVASTPGGHLWKLAESKNIEKIAWEGDVGGRFSAFTAPHLAILEIAGLDTSSFLKAKDSADKDRAENLAKEIFDNYKKGADILDFFIFNSELEDLGKWSRQLIAESLATLTPTVSIGPTDLHSMLELYLERPGSRFTIFVKSEKEIGGSVNQQSFENITAEYKQRNLPLFIYSMSQIDEYEVGKFMSFMFEVTLSLAKLLGVNPFDQPEVENYKKSILNP